MRAEGRGFVFFLVYGSGFTEIRSRAGTSPAATRVRVCLPASQSAVWKNGEVSWSDRICGLVWSVVFSVHLVFSVQCLRCKV